MVDWFIYFLPCANIHILIPCGWWSVPELKLVQEIKCGTTINSIQVKLIIDPTLHSISQQTIHLQGKTILCKCTGSLYTCMQGSQYIKQILFLLKLASKILVITSCRKLTRCVTGRCSSLSTSISSLRRMMR